MIEHIDAKVICDSVNEVNNERITTLQIRIPRIILAEFNTHRCLVGGTEIYFDMPTAKGRGIRRVEKFTLEEFWDKWENGAKEGRVPSFINYDHSLIEPDRIYTSRELADIIGFSYTNLNTACRMGLVNATKDANGKTWLLSGQAFIDYRNNMGTRRFSIRERLKEMNLRCYDPENNCLSHTHIVDCWKVGEKPVFEVKASDCSITGTADHLILTTEGWKEIQDLKVDDTIVSMQCHKQTKSEGFSRIDGKYVVEWTHKIRPSIVERQGDVCAECGKKHERYEIHHVIPKYQRPDLAFDENNVVALCRSCHKKMHIEQDWHVGIPLQAYGVKVDAIIPRGIQTVYDISVESEDHNFIANNIVTHNCLSRNFASSRAIPSRILRKEVLNDPFMPIYWGASQKGMSAYTELTGFRKSTAKFVWKLASKLAVGCHWLMEKAGLHKQTCNRIIEPWLSVTGVITATEWENFFKLRISEFAQPEMRLLAEKIKKAIDESTPKVLKENDVHLPYIDDEERKTLTKEECLMVSVARCCRTSYNNMLGKKSNPQEDIALFERATSRCHWSPCEHQAFVPKVGRITKEKQFDLQRNYRGFYQLRAFLDTEKNKPYLKDWYGYDLTKKETNDEQPV